MYISILQCNFVHIFLFAGCTFGGVKDVIFVIDTYATLYQYQRIREFLSNITINLIFISPESSVGIILFDSDAHIHFNLEAYTSLPKLLQAINPGLPYNYGYGRDTAAALRLLLSSAQNGSLGIRNETSNIAIVITGGRSNIPYFTRYAAAALHAANIFDVYAIGYGSSDIYELNTIASDPSFVYFTNFYNRYDVAELKTDVIHQLCSCKNCEFLNQAHAGHMLSCAWFLRIASVRECLYVRVCVCVCVCVSALKAMKN